MSANLNSMYTIPLDQAVEQLRELIQVSPPGEPIIITQDNIPLAKLTPLGHRPAQRKRGTAKDIPHFIAADFDAPLDDFKEYME